MAKKSIILAKTDLVEYLPIIKMKGNEAYPEDMVFATNYALKTDVIEWCFENIGYVKFNTRKARIKFLNEADATLFTLTWL